jgi:23S rRNA (uracil1939-C5)-methyltransferase
MTRLLELTIERPAFGGAGLARLEGQIVFVEGGLPGSRVVARVVKEDKSCLRAVADRVLVASPHAVEPFCPHFGVCGGCTWQDAAYPAQLDFKREIVREQLRRLGGLEPDVAGTVPSPDERYYRNKMEFAFGSGHPSGTLLGLRERFNPSRVLEVETCFLMPEPAMDILRAVRRLVNATQLPPFFARTGTGAWRHLVLRRSEASDKWLAQIIVGPKTPFKRLASMGEALMREFPQLAGLTLGIRRDRSDFAIAEHRVWTLGEDFLEEVLDGLKLRVSTEAFFQTNTRAAALLYAEAVRAARLTGGEAVWDLYCGAGGLSLFLAREARSVTGFEISQEAVDDATTNASLNGQTNCTFVAGDLKDAVARRKARPEVIVLDPPRTGLHPDTADILRRVAPPRMVYLSCNPSTLARDLGRLSADYDVLRVTPVDLFPHTPHVECVAELARKP